MPSEPALPAPFPDVGRPEPSRKAPRPPYITEQPGTVLLVTEYLGRPVYGPDKQKVGTISNLLVDISGRVTGFVTDVGGFLGIGSKGAPSRSTRFIRWRRMAGKHSSWR